MTTWIRRFGDPLEILFKNLPIQSYEQRIQKMLLSKQLSWLMIAWLFANACTAEEPSFLHPLEEDEASLKNQYIIQFYERPTSREAFLDNGIEKLVREIPSRKIFVAKFFSEEAAGRWKSKTRGIKYFEKGEKKGRF